MFFFTSKQDLPLNRPILVTMEGQTEKLPPPPPPEKKVKHQNDVK